MVSCHECRFSQKTGIPSWPIACHRHAPTMRFDNENAASWPTIRAKDAAIGCGDGEKASDK